jgi:hypothetical protein
MLRARAAMISVSMTSSGPMHEIPYEDIPALRRYSPRPVGSS